MVGSSSGSELEQRYSALLLKYDNCFRENTDLKQALARLQHQKDECMREITQVATDRLNLTKDLTRMTEERNSAIQEYNLIMSERDTVHKEIDKLQEELSEKQKKIVSLQDEKKVNMEQIECLKREITSVLIERDRLSKKVQDYVVRHGEGDENSFSSPLRSPSTSHNQWDSSSSGISSSWKQNSLASIGSHRLDSMEQINLEMELIRRQKESLQQELLYSRNEIEMLKKERTMAFDEKEKIALERDSMKTLCDGLRRERDRVVCHLAEAMRDCDDTKRQLREAREEVRELREKFESAKASNRYSLPPYSSNNISSSSNENHSPSVVPTLLDRAYNKIYGERRSSRKTIDVSTEQEARETLASLDKVLADYSDRIHVSKQASKEPKKDRDGGTWPKYRGPHVFKPISETNGVASNEKYGIRSINLRGHSERKSLAIFNPRISRRSLDNHAQPSPKSDKSDNCLYDKVSNGSDRLSSHSSCTGPSNSSTPIPLGHQSPLNNLTLGLQNEKSDSVNHYANFSTLARCESNHRQRSKDDVLDLSSLSAQLKEISRDRDRKSSPLSNHSKPRPHSVHDVLSDAFNMNSITSNSSHRTYSHHPSASLYSAFGSSSRSSSIPTPPIRSTTDTLFRVAQPSNKRTSTLPLHSHSSSLSHNPSSFLDIYRQHPPASPHHSSSSSYRNSNSSHLNSYTNHHTYDSPSRLISSINGNGITTGRRGIENLYQNSSDLKYLSASPKLSSSPLDSRYSTGLVAKSPSESSSSHYPPNSRYSHIPQQSIDTALADYKSDENDSELASSYDGRSTFPKRSQRIRIPSVPSVTSTCSSGKLSTGSIDRASSSALSDRGSPLSFSVEWLSSGRRQRNSKNLKPRPGDLRYIEMIKSTGTLGINISAGPTGVYVTTVEKDSLAHQAGIQIGDQILEICGINMRNAVYDHAANILRQCGERLNLLVQYNPNKLKIPGRFAHEEQDELDNQNDIHENI